MKFSCEKSLLLSAVATTSRAVSIKNPIPALEGILVEAGETLTLTGYNTDTGIRMKVAADIEAWGSLVLSARLFGEIVRKLPDDIVYFTAKGLAVNITCGQSEFNILAIDAQEFPELPSVEHLNPITLGQPVLKAMIGETLFAVSDNESRPIHTGSLFEVEGGQLTIVSVDGFRLAVRKETVNGVDMAAAFSFVVPGSALNEVERISSGEDTIFISQGERHVFFVTGDTMLVCRRLEGDFLAYRNAIPKNNNICIQVETQAMVRSLERVSLIINERMKSPVRCLFEEGSVTMTARTALGDAFDQCTTSGDGQGLEIGFNNKYLMDAMKNAPADKVQMEMSSAVAPAIIRPIDGGDQFTYMVLPVRLRAN